MNTTKLIVIAGFAVAFGAGAISGVLTQRSVSGTAAQAQRPGGDAQPHGSRRRPLAELNLSSEQEKQMGEIWSGVMKHRHDHDEAFRKLRKDRTDAIAALMKTPELKSAYDAIQNDYTEKLAALDTEWKKLTDAAVTKTKTILTGEQSVKYEGILKRQSEGRGRGPGPRPEERATSRPAN